MTDGQDWAQWMQRHGPALLLYARQIVHDPALAEDAVQEGFVRFWLHRRKAPEPLGLLYAAVRSAALDSMRRRQRRNPREQAVARPEACFDVAAAQRESSADVEAALAQLPVEQREVVVLKIWGGLTFTQIAQAIGESVGTSASRYRYAMQKLATLLRAEVPLE